MGKLIVALDLDEKRKIFDLIENLGEKVDFYKVGWISYLVCGEELIKKLKRENKKIFVDFKFFDIPNTVKNAVKIICENGIDMFTFHLIAGKEVIKNIVEIKKLSNNTKAIGVSVLTSFSQEDVKFLGMNLTISQLVEKLVEVSYELGIDGVVCSGEEIENLRKKFPPPFLLIAPGIRISEGRDDQKRVITPKDAIMKGADYIVVGRPIYNNPEPIKVVEKILREIEE